MEAVLFVDCTNGTRAGRQEQSGGERIHTTMLKFNPGYNTFDSIHIPSHLESPDEPNLFRDIFPYDEPSRMAQPPPGPDAACRGKSGSRIPRFATGSRLCRPIRLKQVVEIYKLMHRLGGPKGLIRQAEFFPDTPQGSGGGQPNPFARMPLSRGHGMGARPTAGSGAGQRAWG